MDQRAQKIVDTAIELAERDGYNAVRLRDVAAQAGVALGTVYKRFASKEDILVAAMTREGERLLQRMIEVPPGETPRERVVAFFSAATNSFCARPKLARAMLRAIASGGTITDRLASVHALITAMVIAAMEGTPPTTRRRWGGDADAESRTVALLLEQVWFAALVGWAGNIYGVEGVVRQVELAASRLVKD